MKKVINDVYFQILKISSYFINDYDIIDSHVTMYFINLWLKITLITTTIEYYIKNKV